jgi:ABC-type bacteriocin/lantibiotic exporter with double-glycine peptidase domain
MKKIKNQYLIELLYLLGGDKRKLIFIIPLFVFSSLLDVIGIGLIVPYVSLIVNPESIANGDYKFFLDFFLLPSDNKELLVIASILLLTVFMFKTIFIILINWVIFSFGYKQQVRIRSLLMKSYQNMLYDKFLKRNSSEYILAVSSLTGNFAVTLQTILKAISEIIVAGAILVMLAIINIEVLLILIFLLSITIVFYNKKFRAKVGLYGEKSNIAGQNLLKWLSEGMKGFKEIRILGIENYFFNKMVNNAQEVADNSVKANTINMAPRYIIEFVSVMFVVSIVLFSLILGRDVSTLAPIIAVFGVAALRIIPSANILSSSLITLRFNRNSISKIYNDLTGINKVDTTIIKSEIIQNQDIEKFDNLGLKSINFSYPGSSNYVLNDLSLHIKKNQSIGIIGKSGSGKTTLIDVILGLLTPQAGGIYYNGQSLKDEILQVWMSQVAYLPQQAFLVDDSICNNIAIGESPSQINKNKVISAAKKARLTNLIDHLPEKYDTLIGENGMRLSGGQRQRISLARAFYHDRSIIIMDESTSSLDADTEKEIIKEISYLKGKVTTIIIAHNLNTLKSCDMIYEVKNGNIKPLT